MTLMIHEPRLDPRAPTGTSAGSTVTVERDARMLRESLTRCRRDVSVPLHDEGVRNLLKRIENDRAKPCEHIVTVLYSAFQREAPREAVEAFFRTGLVMVGEWYTANQPTLDLPTLLRMETEARSAAAAAEMELALSPSTKTMGDAAERLRRDFIAIDRLASACERAQTGDVAQRQMAS